ncbi:MAG: hypothetical protein Q9218_000048 [Villophora microphyllina]
MQQQHDHHTVYYRVKFRPIQWDHPNIGEVQDIQGKHDEPSTVRSSLHPQYIDSEGSAVLKNTQHTKGQMPRRCSSLVSPTTKKQRKQPGSASPLVLEQRVLPSLDPDRELYIGSRNGFIRQENVAASDQPSTGWRPFHIFSATPNRPKLTSGALSSSTKKSSLACILDHQQEFFTKIEQICTRSAREYWWSQCTGLSGPSVTSPCTATLPKQGPHPYKSNDSNVEPGRDYPEESGITMMEYVQRINHIQLERARSCNIDSDAAISEALVRTMKLLTWAQQFSSLAESGGYAMSDEGIVEAVIGARDLICWLLDPDGEAAFNDLWEGKCVYGGLVMSEEDL